MEERKRTTDQGSAANRQARYAEELMKTAAFRKRERARRTDRKIQRERDTETYEDTEVFVTEK